MIKRVLALRELGIVAVLLAEVALFAVLCRQPGRPNPFLQPEALLNVVRDSAVLGLAAIGTTVIIVAGGIDLSVGSVLALCAVVVASLMEAGHALWAVPVGLLVGIACGLITASIINAAKLPPFIVTLGMMSVARGSAFLVTGGRTVTLPESTFTHAVGGNIMVAGVLVPVPALIWVGVALLAAMWLSRSRLGRAVTALGGNEEAARLSGLPIARLKRVVYGLGGGMAAMAGSVFVAYYGTGQSTAAGGWELDAIAAAVLGGASLNGGRGSIIGTCVGAVIFRVLQRGLTMLGASDYSQVITGIVVVAVVVLDQFATRRAHRAG
ncbi:MAG: ABC transporter permease [Armatimonadetes bacterium]|nr:ABC transporter permease [Armatimonadota bacterium]